MLIARPGAHNPEYWDESRECWTGHPFKASNYATEEEAQEVIEANGLDADDAYVLE